MFSGGYPPGTVIFESSTAGTYSVNIEYAGTFEVILVGGGGASTIYDFSLFYRSAAGGGSGAYMKYRQDINNGQYSCVVGNGNSGNSSFISNIAGGGLAGNAQEIIGGAGGTYSLITGQLLEGANGKNGVAKQNVNYPAVAGGASVYNGYGAGAGAGSSGGSTSAGTAGYVKIVAV